MSRLAKLEWTGWSWSWFLSCMSFLMLLSTQVSSKEAGSNFCLKRCINWIFVNEIRSGRGKIPSFLNKGSVCELKDDPEIILTAFFCLWLSRHPCTTNIKQVQHKGLWKYIRSKNYFNYIWLFKVYKVFLNTLKQFALLNSLFENNYLLDLTVLPKKTVCLESTIGFQNCLLDKINSLLQ